MQVGIGIGIDSGTKTRKILIRDRFNRADNATSLGSTETGQVWTPQSNTPGIIGNQAYMAVGTGRVMISTTISDKFATQITFAVVSALDNVQRLHFRYVDSANEMFIGKLNATTYALVKRVAGALTTLGSIAQAPVNGDIVRVEVNGSNIKAKINGVKFAEVTESANLTGTGFGIFADTTTRFDNFTVEEL